MPDFKFVQYEYTFRQIENSPKGFRMYSFIEMDENYEVEELSSDELISIISSQRNNDSTSHMEESGNKTIPSTSNLSLSQRLSKFANEPLADWLIKKI
jgi:hypothetical protein